MRGRYLLAVGFAGCLAPLTVTSLAASQSFPNAVPARLSVLQSFGSLLLGQSTDIRIVLLDQRGQPIAAHGDLSVILTATTFASLDGARKDRQQQAPASPPPQSQAQRARNLAFELPSGPSTVQASAVLPDGQTELVLRFTSRQAGAIRIFAESDNLVAGAALLIVFEPRRTVFVSVTDEGGQPVAGLAPQDFTVTEGGQKRDVILVTPAQEPLSIAVLVDDSQAADPYMRDIREALLAFVRRLYLKHEIALVRYSGPEASHATYTRDLYQLTAAVERVHARPGSGSYLLEALTEVAEGLRNREAGRAAIVIVDANGPEFSNRFHQNVVAAVKKSGAVVYALEIGSGGPQPERGPIEARESLDGSVRATGGNNWYLLTGQGLSKPLLQIVRELESRYRLVYASGGRPGSAEVRVSVARPGLKARVTPVAE